MCGAIKGVQLYLWIMALSSCGPILCVLFEQSPKLLFVVVGLIANSYPSNRIADSIISLARVSLRDGSRHFRLWLRSLSLRPSTHSHDPHHHSRIRVLLPQFSAAGALHAALPRRSLRDHRQYSPTLLLMRRLPQHLLQLPHSPHRPRQRRALLPAVRVLPCRLPLLRRHVVLHQRFLHPSFHSSQHVNLSLHLLFCMHRCHILPPLSHQSLPFRTSHQQGSSSSPPSHPDRQLHQHHLRASLRPAAAQLSRGPSRLLSHAVQLHDRHLRRCDLRRSVLPQHPRQEGLSTRSQVVSPPSTPSSRYFPLVLPLRLQVAFLAQDLPLPHHQPSLHVRRTRRGSALLILFTHRPSQQQPRSCQ